MSNFQINNVKNLTFKRTLVSNEWSLCGKIKICSYIILFIIIVDVVVIVVVVVESHHMKLIRIHMVCKRTKITIMSFFLSWKWILYLIYIYTYRRSISVLNIIFFTCFFPFFLVLLLGHHAHTHTTQRGYFLISTVVCWIYWARFFLSYINFQFVPYTHSHRSLTSDPSFLFYFLHRRLFVSPFFSS